MQKRECSLSDDIFDTFLAELKRNTASRTDLKDKDKKEEMNKSVQGKEDELKWELWGLFTGVEDELAASINPIPNGLGAPAVAFFNAAYGKQYERSRIDNTKVHISKIVKKMKDAEPGTGTNRNMNKRGRDNVNNPGNQAQRAKYDTEPGTWGNNTWNPNQQNNWNMNNNVPAPSNINPMIGTPSKGENDKGQQGGTGKNNTPSKAQCTKERRDEIFKEIKNALEKYGPSSGETLATRNNMVEALNDKFASDMPKAAYQACFTNICRNCWVKTGNWAEHRTELCDADIILQCGHGFCREWGHLAGKCPNRVKGKGKGKNPK
jgi:hypothetical protein